MKNQRKYKMEYSEEGKQLACMTYFQDTLKYKRIGEIKMATVTSNEKKVLNEI